MKDTMQYVLITIISLTLAVFSIGASKFLTGTNYDINTYIMLFIFNIVMLTYIVKNR